MPRIIEYEGRRIQVPDDFTDADIEQVLTGGAPASAPPTSAGAPAPAPKAEPSWFDSLVSGADYIDNTASIAAQGARRGVSGMFGLPVDLMNAGLGFAGVPVSDKPFLGSAFIDSILNAPSEAVAAATGTNANVEPTDALQRVVGRIGQELGATAVPVGGALGTAAALGKEGVKQLGPLARYFVQPAAVAPANLVGKETAFAAGAGLGAGTANEMAGNPQTGDNFWSDFLGSLAGATATGLGSRIVGAGRKVVGAITGKPEFMDEVAGEAVADRIVNSSSDLGKMYAETGKADTTALAEKLRRPAPVEQAIPGYVANIGDRAQDPMLMTLVQNQDMRTPGAANVRRAGNETAINAQMDRMAPSGDPAQFRAALEANRDAQIAEVLGAEDAARQIFREAEQAVQPGMRDATARGSSLRAGLADSYSSAQDYVDSLFSALDGANARVPIEPLANRFGSVTDNLPLNDRARFTPSEATVPDRLVPRDAEGTPIPGADVPLREVTSTRSGLSDDIRNAQQSGNRQQARVARQYRDQIDEFMGAVLPAETQAQYDAARAARRDVGDRFERPGTGIAETLRTREGGGYQMDDSAVTGRFAQTDQGRINDTRALLREAGNDPRVRSALADEVLADIQQRGLLDRPEQLRAYLDERSILLGEFPELRRSLNRARSASEYRGSVETASAETQKRLNTPGKSAQASYLKFADEATVDAVRNLTSGPKPREAARELLDAAGNTPEARANAKAALWEAVKTKRFRAPDAMGTERWDAKKLKAFFDDPKTAAVADELWSDNPEDLANIKEVFAALAGAEGSIRTRAPNSSGTAQALSGKFDPSMTAASIASRGRSVTRGQLSPFIAGIDLLGTWLRNKSKKVQARAIDELASAAFNNPGLAADLLEKFNPADWAAKRRLITQKYGARVTQLVNLFDEAQAADETMDVISDDR